MLDKAPYSQLRLDLAGYPVWKISTFEHNDRGQVTLEAEWYAGTTTYDYNSTWGYLTDVDGPLTGTDDASKFTVDERFGVQTSVDPPDVAATTMTYDGLGRLATVTLPGAPAASYKFAYSLDPDGNRAAWTSTETLRDTAGNYTLSYGLVDGFGKRIQTQTPTADGASTVISSVRYGPNGQPGATYNPTVAAGAPDGLFKTYVEAATPRAEHTYTDYGKVTTEYHDAAGLQATAWTREEGFETYAMDGNGRATRTRHNVFGDTESVIDPAGGTTVYYYNRRRDVTSIVGPDGANIQTFYDKWEPAPTKIVDPDLGTVTYTYDLAGRRETQSDARGVTTTVNYRPDSQPDSISHGANTAVSWGYEPSGRLMSSYV